MWKLLIKLPWCRTSDKNTVSHLFVWARNRKVIRFSTLPRAHHMSCTKTTGAVELVPLTKPRKPQRTRTSRLRRFSEKLSFSFSVFCSVTTVHLFFVLFETFQLQTPVTPPTSNLMLKYFEYRLNLTVYCCHTVQSFVTFSEHGDSISQRYVETVNLHEGTWNVFYFHFSACIASSTEIISFLKTETNDRWKVWWKSL